MGTCSSCPRSIDAFTEVNNQATHAKTQKARESCGIQPSLFDIVEHGAARLGLVTAVSESAATSRRFDLGEGRAHGLGVEPQTELSHTRCVDQAGPARQHDELAEGRGVTSLPVTGSDLCHDLPRLAEKTIDEGRLADP